MKLHRRTLQGNRLCSIAMLASISFGSAAAQLSTHPLTPQQAAAVHARVKPALVQGITGPLLFQDKQAFEVSGPGMSSFTLMPVRYNSRTDWGGTLFRCGVVFLPAGQPPNFLRTIGYDWTEVEQCEGINGIGFVDLGGKTPPQVILLWSAASPNTSVNEPMVLDWDPAANRYRSNAAISQRLENDLRTFTIAAVKQQLKVYEVAAAR